MGNICRCGFSPLAFMEVLRKNDINDLKNLLQNADREDLSRLTATKANYLMVACLLSSSLETFELSLAKLLEVGGAEMLKTQLTQQDAFGWCVIIFVCASESSASTQMMKIILDKIAQSLSDEVFKNQLTSPDVENGRTCLMTACTNSSPHCAPMIKLLMDKMSTRIGGYLLKTQLTATLDKKKQNCLMFVCRNTASPEVLELVCSKILEIGSPELLKNQFAAKNDDGLDCLKYSCSNRTSSHVELVKLVFQKIREVGGVDFVRSQVTDLDNDGWNCLMIACRHASSVAVVKLVVENIIVAGGTELLKRQLSSSSYKPGEGCLLLAGNNSSSDPKLAKFIAALLFHFDLFVEHYTNLEKHKYPRVAKSADSAIKGLSKAGVESSWFSSWSPDAASVAEVNQLLEEASAHKTADERAAAKKRAEEQAAWRKKAEEDAIASRKRAEEAEAARRRAEQLAAAKRRAEAEEEARKRAHELALAQQKAARDQQARIEQEVAAARKKAEEEAAARKKAEEEAAAKKNAEDDEELSVTFDSPPPSRCFKRGVPDKNLEDSVNALFSIKEAPSKRPDLKNWIPDRDDASNLLHYLNTSLNGLKSRPAVKKLIAENGLTDDDIKILHSYKIQSPYPVYLWINGWLGGDRRDDFVKEHVAPFFVLLYRAMEKLPRITTVADRAIKVNGIASLKNTFDNFKVACAPGNTLSFWGFSSFSTESDVVNREEFVGKPQEEAIVYSCGRLEGVDMEPFAPQGLKSESEILPLCPCVLEVVNHVKMGQKLVVGVKQLNHADFSYVAPK